MKKTLTKILDLCSKITDEDGVLNDISIKAKNKLIRIEWLEKYWIELDSYINLAQTTYYDLGDYQCICYYKDWYYSHENNTGHSISWSEDWKQPVDEWIYKIWFSTGAYIFGDDYNYQQDLFQKFFEELKTYNPDYIDNHNDNLYWKIENAKNIKDNFKEIFKKYQEINRSELNQRKIIKLQKELNF